MNRSTAVPQPLPYQGSKRRIAARILRHFPRRIDRLVEPFCGSAALSLAAAHGRRCQHFWLNDRHQPLVDLWRRLLREPETLADGYERLWHAQAGREREFFLAVRERFNERPQPEDFLYLLARCVKAAVRYNREGQFNNTPDHRRRGTRPDEMRRRIRRAAELLGKDARLTCWDYRRVLRQSRETDLIYMDPPYQGVSGTRDSRYLPRVDFEPFCGELERLNERGRMFAVSYDGRTGKKQFGRPLPAHLELLRVEIPAGRSTQATLHGRRQRTFESLYLSPALVRNP